MTAVSGSLLECLGGTANREVGMVKLGVFTLSVVLPAN